MARTRPSSPPPGRLLDDDNPFTWDAEPLPRPGRTQNFIGFGGPVDWTDDPRWLAAGLLGNVVFFSRFLVQWLASERAGFSYVPRMFWHLSLIGSAFLLAYALHRRDPIFVLAYLPNGFVYLRNLALLRRTGAPAASNAPTSEAHGQQGLGADRLARHGPS